MKRLLIILSIIFISSSVFSQDFSNYSLEQIEYFIQSAIDGKIGPGIATCKVKLENGIVNFYYNQIFITQDIHQMAQWQLFCCQIVGVITRTFKWKSDKIILIANGKVIGWWLTSDCRSAMTIQNEVKRLAYIIGRFKSSASSK